MLLTKEPTATADHSSATAAATAASEPVYEVSGGSTGSGGFFLCCVCHEQNTTYRYEVIYEQKNLQINNNKGQKAVAGPASNNSSNLLALTHQTTDGVDSGIHSATEGDSSDDHDYYNFPPRHPRHGHLKWSPVSATLLRSTALANKHNPNLTLNDNFITVKTYPDYPVHIPTFTLKRSSLKRGKAKAIA